MCYQTKGYAMFCVIRQKAMQCFSFVIRQKAMRWVFCYQTKSYAMGFRYQTKDYTMLLFVLSDKRLCNVDFCVIRQKAMQCGFSTSE